jgi:hypothetical protein
MRLEKENPFTSEEYIRFNQLLDAIVLDSKLHAHANTKRISNRAQRRKEKNRKR